MECWLKVVLIGGMAVFSVPLAFAQSDAVATPQSSLKSTATTGDVSGVPPAPRGKSTIMGGEIRNVDPVLDRFTLKVYGERPLRILFDERTQVFRDGTRIPLRELHPEQHASVQTILDGSDVFALSVHILSQTPGGDCQGHVASYDAATGTLMVNSSLSREPVKLIVGPQTQIVREGQSAFTSAGSGTTDLKGGALVSVTFEADKQGRAVARRIAILATPGSTFIFSGNVTAFDLHSGNLVLVDPRDDKSYQISFDQNQVSGAESLHTGDRVRVTASFDGNRYVASEISTN